MRRREGVAGLVAIEGVSTMQADQKSNGIQVIRRAADILRALGQEKTGMSLGQIARAVALPRSTVQRIVQALSDEGFITAEQGGGRIRLGPEIQSLAQASVRDTRDVLRPILRQIADETGETVDLAVLDGDTMLFVEQIEGSQRLRTVSSIGDRFPLTTTANGKAALACLEEAAAARLVIAELERQSGEGQSLTTTLAQVEQIRNGALARDEDEHTEGVSALGFAMRDARGDVFAISVPVPSTRYVRVHADLAEVLERHRQAVG